MSVILNLFQCVYTHDFLKRQSGEFSGDLHWGNKTDKLKSSILKYVEVKINLGRDGYKLRVT